MFGLPLCNQTSYLEHCCIYQVFYQVANLLKRVTTTFCRLAALSSAGKGGIQPTCNAFLISKNNLKPSVSGQLILLLRSHTSLTLELPTIFPLCISPATTPLSTPSSPSTKPRQLRLRSSMSLQRNGTRHKLIDLML